MDRGLYTADHEAFRGLVRTFDAREVVGKLEDWYAGKRIPREVWEAAGRSGVLGLTGPEEFGGGGQAHDFRFCNVVYEELANVYATPLSASFAMTDDGLIQYINLLGSQEQKERWLPGLIAGKIIGSIAMTEPGTGSDLQGVRTSGSRVEGGWIVNGAKTFITLGIYSDIIITVVRTDPTDSSRAHSLLVVEAGMDGFSRGRNLAKAGLDAQDTAELFFEDVFVPDANVLGEIGGGFAQLSSLLPLERLGIAALAVAGAEAILQATVDYTRTREAFGQRIAEFQNTRFQLADMATEIDVARAYLDRAIIGFNHGTLTGVEAAKAKLFASETNHRVVDRCLQLHGGYGYMLEYPVARAYQDVRVQRIFGGTSEIMRTIIGRDLVGRA